MYSIATRQERKVRSDGSYHKYNPEMGAESLELQVNVNNKAKGFYERLGFVKREKIDLDIGNGYL